MSRSEITEKKLERVSNPVERIISNLAARVVRENFKGNLANFLPWSNIFHYYLILSLIHVLEESCLVHRILILAFFATGLYFMPARLVCM